MVALGLVEVVFSVYIELENVKISFFAISSKKFYDYCIYIYIYFLCSFFRLYGNDYMYIT